MMSAPGLPIAARPMPGFRWISLGGAWFALRGGASIAAITLGLLLFMPTLCGARTFKILDTTTGKPVLGAVAHLIARGTFPIGLGHPGEFTLAEWDLKSDENGEINLSSIWADRAWVFSLSAPGYGKTDTVQEYTYRRSEKPNNDVLFLTPRADLAYENVRYLFHISALAVETNQGLAGMRPMFTLAVLYPQAKRSAKRPRELEALRQFCRFAPDMAAQKAAGWPDMGTLPEIKAAGQALIDDCAVP